MEFTHASSEQHYAGLVRAGEDALVCLDFDGVLAPIVEDPAAAHVHPDAAEVLLALAEEVRAVAVVTGRPARQALALGGLEELGAAMEARGRTLHLRGQYGNEQWSSDTGRVVSPRPPAGLTAFSAELPDVLAAADAREAFVEDKGLAVGVHTRRLPDPAGALEALREPVAALAARHDLVVEPGRHVLEVRAHGADKGAAVRELVAMTGASAVLFAGDDLGDLAAFEEVARLRSGGAEGLLVASVSDAADAVTALTDRADVVVDGPAGVLALLRELTRDTAGARL
ncbi:trehalose-phosphatase [Nocardioides lentus]|uniref:Trehalose 6-phosphate phosphatase n=1 Tax=Nocardioides lentus TaxID=338077 RepID=A0ABN2PGI1_9ACTN